MGGKLLTGAVELQKELAKQFGLDLPATFVFDYPTINEMRTFLEVAVPRAPGEVFKDMEENRQGVGQEAGVAEVNASTQRASLEEDASDDTSTQNEPIWLRMLDAERKTHITSQVIPNDLEK